MQKAEKCKWEATENPLIFQSQNVVCYPNVGGSQNGDKYKDWELISSLYFLFHIM